MGVILHNTSFIEKARGRKKYRAITLSRMAAEMCLQAERLNGPLGCLINTGIYRDKHIGEPAIAILIHGGIKAHTGEPFCFDLNNGRTGVIHALEASSSLINNGQFETGLIVSGDAIPTLRDRKVYPYASAASAMLIQYHPDPIGFVKFYHRTFNENIELYTSSLRWQTEKGRNHKKHTLHFQQRANYIKTCQAMTEETIRSFLEEEKLDPEHFDLVISTLDYPEVHTAGLGKAITMAKKQRQFDSARNILLIAAGAGIEVSLAWYKNRPDA